MYQKRQKKFKQVGVQNPALICRASFDLYAFGGHVDMLTEKGSAATIPDKSTKVQVRSTSFLSRRETHLLILVLWFRILLTIICHDIQRWTEAMTKAGKY